MLLSVRANTLAQKASDLSEGEDVQHPPADLGGPPPSAPNRLGRGGLIAIVAATALISAGLGTAIGAMAIKSSSPDAAAQGLLFLAMIFVSSAVGVALVASRGADYGADVHVFGQALLIALSKTYALRMAAVFMMSLATIWLKTGLVSRGLVIFTYVVALTLLVASDVTVWLTLAFPVWVLIVSVLALSKAGLIDLHRDGD